MTFEYEHYALRKPRMDDAEGFFEISHDQEAMQYYEQHGWHHMDYVRLYGKELQ